VSHAREATTMPPRVVGACVTDLKAALANAILDGSHAHARYEIEVDATYVGKR
jgi:hypothetical protein